MSGPPEILLSGIEFIAAPETLRATGLLGWIRARLNGRLGLDGIAVRRTARGELVLAYPSRRDRYGREHPIVWPVDDASRRELDGQVLSELQERGELP